MIKNMWKEKSLQADENRESKSFQLAKTYDNQDRGEKRTQVENLLRKNRDQN